MRITIHGEVVAFQSGQYNQIVIKNLDEFEDSWDRYKMITICPNWQGVLPRINDSGYFEYEDVTCGESYLKTTTGETNFYRYSGSYFINYIKDPEQIEKVKEFKF